MSPSKVKTAGGIQVPPLPLSLLPPANLYEVWDTPYSWNGVPKYAADMDALKMAVQYSPRGTGDVRRVIESCTFRPREQAFTALINLCGRLRDWEKAMEVFETMRRFPGVRPNTYSYSALISACSNSGKYGKSLEVFLTMKKAAKEDPECKPNLVTYSAIIGACERGGMFEIAVDLYDEMVRDKISPDRITFVSALAACEKSANWSKAEAILSTMHEQSLAGTSSVYYGLLNHYAMVGGWDKALDLFIVMQMMGKSANRGMCRALMWALEAGDQAYMALQLLDSMWDAGMVIDLETYNSALRALAKCGKWETSLTILREIEAAQLKVNLDTAHAIVWSCIKGGKEVLARSLAEQFNTHGLKVDVGRLLERQD